MTKSKGQTALEYLLVVVIAIVVTVAVLALLQSASKGVRTVANNTTADVRCARTDCSDNEICEEVCGPGAQCNYRGLCELP